MQKSFDEAMEFRHACKIFDKEKKITDLHMREILEAGRLSPSSFGMEPWKFLVITDEEFKAKLRPFCWDQVQVTSCSHLVVVLAAVQSVKPASGIPQKMLQRRPLSSEKLEFYIDLYASHLQKTLSSDENILCWTAKQTYIAAANMMTKAATLGIDSCPIEGFEKEKVERELAIDTDRYQLSLVLPFGYRVQEPGTRNRLSFDEVVEYLP